MNNENQYDKWNRRKKQIEVSTNELLEVPEKGHVWMAVLGKNIGYEQNGSGATFRRPILIIKRFNSAMFWCVPLSTQQKHISFYFNYQDPKGRHVSAILAQLRLISSKRMITYEYTMNHIQLIKILKRLSAYMQ